VRVLNKALYEMMVSVSVAVVLTLSFSWTIR
jgi:hypothetical protein